MVGIAQPYHMVLLHDSYLSENREFDTSCPFEIVTVLIMHKYIEKKHEQSFVYIAHIFMDPYA